MDLRETKDEKKEVKLHLGCGSIRIPGYINVDINNLESVDVVADISCLPYEESSVDMIYSCATIEHFSRRMWMKVLSHWYFILKPGGVLRISTADFESVCKEYLENWKIEELLGLVVGGQRDKYDMHGMVFDFDILKSGLEKCGFKEVRRYDRKNTDISKMGIDDYSQSYLPHMDFDTGRLMMLNVEAKK